MKNKVYLSDSVTKSKKGTLNVETGVGKNHDDLKTDDTVPVNTPATTASTATNFTFDSPEVSSCNASHDDGSSRLEKDSAVRNESVPCDINSAISSEIYEPACVDDKTNQETSHPEKDEDRPVHKRKRSLLESRYKLSSINKYYGSVKERKR